MGVGGASLDDIELVRFMVVLVIILGVGIMFLLLWCLEYRESHEKRFFAILLGSASPASPTAPHAVEESASLVKMLENKSSKSRFLYAKVIGDWKLKYYSTPPTRDYVYGIKFFQLFPPAPKFSMLALPAKANKFTFAESRKTGTGGWVWMPSLALCNLFSVGGNPVLSAAYFQNKKVVELGSGCGVLGAVLGSLELDEIVLTDRAKAIPTLEYNMRMQAHLAAKVIIRELEWGTTPLPECVCGADIVLGCDILYNPEVYPLLYQTLLDLCSQSRTGIVDIVLSYEERCAEKEQAFIDHFRAHRDIQVTTMQIPFVSELPLHIFHFRYCRPAMGPSPHSAAAPYRASSSPLSPPPSLMRPSLPFIAANARRSSSLTSKHRPTASASASLPSSTAPAVANAATCHAKAHGRFPSAPPPQLVIPKRQGHSPLALSSILQEQRRRHSPLRDSGEEDEGNGNEEGDVSPLVLADESTPTIREEKEDKDKEEEEEEEKEEEEEIEKQREREREERRQEEVFAQEEMLRVEQEQRVQDELAEQHRQEEAHAQALRQRTAILAQQQREQRLREKQLSIQQQQLDLQLQQLALERQEKQLEMEKQQQQQRLAELQYEQHQHNTSF